MTNSKADPTVVPFKACAMCGQAWNSLEEFLGDREIEVVDYQVNFGELDEGFFLFNHVRPACGTTLALKAGVFRGLYNGPVFVEPLRGAAECPGYCVKKGLFKTCPAKCECAYVLEILSIVRCWPKQDA